MILGEILDTTFQKVPYRFFEEKNNLTSKIAWIFIYQKKILVAPIQLSELHAFKWTSVTFPDL